MRDLRIVQTKAALTITSISPIRSFEPPSILIIGDRFEYAEEVLFNGVEVLEFVIASPSRIIARIPDSQLGLQMVSVSVLSTVPSAGNSSLLSLGLSKVSRSVSGLDKLVQDWMLIFMTNPGSDIFDPEAGGGARALIGKSGSSADATADLSLAVSRTREQLLHLQAKLPRIPPEERLLSASLTDARFDESTTTLTAVVDIRNMVGASASVAVR